MRLLAPAPSSISIPNGHLRFILEGYGEFSQTAHRNFAIRRLPWGAKKVGPAYVAADGSRARHPRRETGIPRG